MHTVNKVISLINCRVWISNSSEGEGEEVQGIVTKFNWLIKCRLRTDDK